MTSDPITCVSIQLPSPVHHSSKEEQVRRVFRTSRDMRNYHEKLINERKTVSTMPTPASRFSQSPHEKDPISMLKSHGSDACTETDFEELIRLGKSGERKEVSKQEVNANSVIPEQPKPLPVVPRRLLVTAGSVRTSVSTLSSKPSESKKRRLKERFSETMGWSEPATRAFPFIDFSSAVRTTVVHVEEAFSPSRILRPAGGFYTRLPPRTSPRTKRIGLPGCSSHPTAKPYPIPSISQSPLLPEDMCEEALPRKMQAGRTMWKYRGLSLNTTAVFDIRPILTWKKRMDEVFEEAVS